MCSGKGASWGAASGASLPVVVALISHRGIAYEEGLKGFEEALAGKGIQSRIDVHYLDGEESNAARVLDQYEKNPPPLCLSLGSVATTGAVKWAGRVPIVAGLILNDDELKANPNVTGVTLEFPLDLQFQWLNRVLPGCRNVGTMYSASQRYKMELAEAAAQKSGLRFFAEFVQAPPQLPFALDALAKRADVLWGIPDDLVFNPQTAVNILLFSFKQRIPVVGISEAWVRAGALYALHWDYRDLGLQCGEMAAQILQGASPRSLPLAVPRKIRILLNPKTAQTLKIEIPEAVLRSSCELIK